MSLRGPLRRVVPVRVSGVGCVGDIWQSAVRQPSRPLLVCTGLGVDRSASAGRAGWAWKKM